MLLMHENIPVAKIKMYLGNICDVTQVINPEHLPVGTNHPGSMLWKYLNAWQRDRSIPFNRQSYDLYTRYFSGSPLEAAQISGSFSLTDHYWFKEEDSDEKWEDLCFQKNGFTSNFTDFFFDMVTKNIPYGDRNPRVPDANTDGVLPKIWVQTGEKDFSLIKFGEYEYVDKCHLLSANEVACSKIAKEMGINAVEYNLYHIPGLEYPVCECANFVPENMEFVTLAQIAKESAGEKFDLYRRICDMDYEKEVKDMLRFFFFIHNKDGHTRNCGFLRDAKTLKIHSFAPLFDHGCALNFDGFGSTDQSVKPFRATRLEQIALVDKLGEMPDFEKTADIIKETYDAFHVPDEQLDLALEDLIETCNEWEKIAERENEGKLIE